MPKKLSWQRDRSEWLLDFIIRQQLRRLWVALSGGRDSLSLLHWLVQQRSRLPELYVVHVNHQLQTAAADWANHCQQIAEAWHVPLVVLTVTVPQSSGDSLEAAARRVRYGAFRSLLQTGDALLTAHHADDQAETLLLALLRGSGAAGLAAMPTARRLGAGLLLRPWLAVAAEDIAAYASAHQIPFVEDPTNQQTKFARNYLRHQVMPRLRDRWPSVAATMSRTAQWCGEAARLERRFWVRQLTPLLTADGGLSLATWAELTPTTREGVLRFWLKKQRVSMPSSRQLARFAAALAAPEDRQPSLIRGEIALRRYRQVLHCVPLLPPLRQGPWHWQPGSDGDNFICDGFGELVLEAAAEGLQPVEIKEVLTITRRRGGERFRPLGRRHSQSLKRLLQEAQMPPWWRERVLLVWRGGALVAVSGLGVSADHAVANGWQCNWKKPNSVANMRDFSRKRR